MLQSECHIREIADRVLREDRYVALVHGPTGIGKTYVLEGVDKTLGSELPNKVTRVHYRCLPTDHGYEPFVELIEALQPKGVRGLLRFARENKGVVTAVAKVALILVPASSELLSIITSIDSILASRKGANSLDTFPRTDVRRLITLLAKCLKNPNRRAVLLIDQLE